MVCTVLRVFSRAPLIWCRGQDSNLRSRSAPDLQSGGFNHSPTPARGWRALFIRSIRGILSRRQYQIISSVPETVKVCRAQPGVGARERTRTSNRPITSRVRYQLRHSGLGPVRPCRRSMPPFDAPPTEAAQAIQRGPHYREFKTAGQTTDGSANEAASRCSGRRCCA